MRSLYFRRDVLSNCAAMAIAGCDGSQPLYRNLLLCISRHPAGSRIVRVNRRKRTSAGTLLTHECVGTTAFTRGSRLRPDARDGTCGRSSARSHAAGGFFFTRDSQCSQQVQSSRWRSTAGVVRRLGRCSSSMGEHAQLKSPIRTRPRDTKSRRKPLDGYRRSLFTYANGR